MVVQPYRWLTFAGFMRHIGDMRNEWRWSILAYVLGMREGFPSATYDRVQAFPTFTMHVRAPWTGASVEGDKVILETQHGPLHAASQRNERTSGRLPVSECGLCVHRTQSRRGTLDSGYPSVWHRSDLFAAREAAADIDLYRLDEKRRRTFVDSACHGHPWRTTNAQAL
jgi:hypothetical protein